MTLINTLDISSLDELVLSLLATILAASWAFGYGGGTQAYEGCPFNRIRLHQAQELEALGLIELKYSTRQGWRAEATCELKDRYMAAFNGSRGSRILRDFGLSDTQAAGARAMLSLMS